MTHRSIRPQDLLVFRSLITELDAGGVRGASAQEGILRMAPAILEEIDRLRSLVSSLGGDPDPCEGCTPLCDRCA